MRYIFVGAFSVDISNIFHLVVYFESLHDIRLQRGYMLFSSVCVCDKVLNEN